MKLLYLLIDTLAVLVPLLASFHPKLNFYKTWKPLFKSIFLIAIPFLLADSLFISRGVWSFNPMYITGIYVFNLPIEEILFFICIPYSCLFTYYCLTKFYKFSWNKKSENIFYAVFSLILLITGIVSWRKLYTSTTFISTALLCIVLKFVVKANWLAKAASIYGILLVPFIIVNGILTGSGLYQPVVRYNITENLGIRILTIPLEDFIYGFELFLLNLSLYLRFSDNALRSPDSRKHWSSV